MPLISELDLTVSARYAPETYNVWSEAKVASWIADLGMKDHSEKFLEHNITGDILFDLRHEHLREMGISAVADRMRLFIMLKRLRDEYIKRPSLKQRLQRKTDQSAGSSSLSHSLRVDTSVSSARSTSGSPYHRSRSTADTIKKLHESSQKYAPLRKVESESIREDAIEKKRVIRVVTEEDSSRIIDITDINTLKQLFMRICQKFSITRLDSDMDTDKMDKEMDKWVLYYVGKNEGKIVREEEVPRLGGNFTGGEDMIQKYFLRRHHSKGRKKFAKLENFFGEKISVKPADSATSSSPSSPLSASVINAEKLTKIFGDRPPSEFISGNLNKFFPDVSDENSSTSSKKQLESKTIDTTTPQPESNSTSYELKPKAKVETNVKSTELLAREIKWAKGNVIGTGSFGHVYMGLNTETGEIMAVKQVAMPDNDEESPASKLQSRKRQMIEALHREIAFLKELEHPNIVRYLGSSSTEQYLNIFLEYVPGGSISSALANYGIFEESLIKNYVKQILLGLSYLHEKNIVHRDIKGANILIDNKGTVKITDFGISKKLGDGKDRGSVISLYAGGNTPNRTSALQGSVFWMSPEVVKHYHYTQKSDVWSFGCVLIEMLTGKHPWPDLPQMTALYKIGSAEAPEIPQNASRKLKSMMEKCFIINYRERPQAKVLLQHEFLVD